MEAHPWLREEGDENYIDELGDSMVEPFEETHEYLKRYFKEPKPMV